MGQNARHIAPSSQYVNRYFVPTFPHYDLPFFPSDTSSIPYLYMPLLWFFSFRNLPWGWRPDDSDTFRTLCWRFADRPGPMFSEGAMASVSHKLEMMMCRFSFWVLIVQGHLVTMSNGYSIKYFNILLAMLHI